MKTTFGVPTARFVLVDLIGDLLYWPVWWYTRGFVKTARFFGMILRNKERQLGIRVWMRNLFVPMFGQYDMEGRLISFFARIVVIGYRSVVLFIWTLAIVAIILSWLLLPLVVYWQLAQYFI